MDSRSFDGENMNLNKFLLAGYQYVSDGWIPASPSVVAEVQQGFNSNLYTENRPQLIADIMKDAGLFTHCVRQLMISQDPNEAQVLIDPVEVIRTAPLGDLREIVSQGTSGLHSFLEASDVQVELLQHNLISTTTANLLAQHLNINQDTAYACATFRQLGKLLIAWNYPHIYERAQELSREGESLERNLNKMLGFSPAALGFTIASQWSLTPELRIGIGDTNVDLSGYEDADQLFKTGELLQKVCRLGETLAKVANPVTYPNAQHDWSSVKEEFFEILGPDALATLKQNIRAASAPFLKTNSSILESLDAIIDSPTRTRKRTSLKLANNLYIKYCSPTLKRMLEALYERIRNSADVHDSIEFLVKDIVPTAGFRTGCIYLLDPDTRCLAPRTSIGTSPPEGLRQISVQGFDVDDSLVAVAYKTNNMVMSEEGGVLKCAAVLGDTQRAGVLYLETSETLMPNGMMSLKPHFRAVKQALCDCMDLN